MPERRRFLVAGALTLAFVAYLGAVHLAEVMQRGPAVTVYEDSALGISNFAETAQIYRTGSTEARGRPVLLESELSAYKALLFLSPMAAISERESGLIRSWVEGGGTLFLSFHREKSEALAGLLTKLDIKTPLRPDTAFRNGEPRVSSPRRETALFKPSEKYAFYSDFQFDVPGCALGAFECYVLQSKIGRGEVYVVAGLPPMANVMLARADNAQVGGRLVDLSGKVAIDEYHHFFSDKGMGDLLKNPRVTLPLAGMVAAALLFFLFGHTEFQEATAQPLRSARYGGYHQINARILRRTLESDASGTYALELQRGFLARLFPARKPELEGVSAQEPLLAQAQKLTELHSSYLKQREGRNLWQTSTPPK